MPCGELVLGRPEGQPDALESDQSRDDGGMEDGEAGRDGGSETRQTQESPGKSQQHLMEPSRACQEVT